MRIQYVGGGRRRTIKRANSRIKFKKGDIVQVVDARSVDWPNIPEAKGIFAEVQRPWVHHNWGMLYNVNYIDNKGLIAMINNTYCGNNYKGSQLKLVRRA